MKMVLSRVFSATILCLCPFILLSRAIEEFSHLQGKGGKRCVNVSINTHVYIRLG